MNLFWKTKQFSCLCFCLGFCGENALCDSVLTTEAEKKVSQVNSAEIQNESKEELKDKSEGSFLPLAQAFMDKERPILSVVASTELEIKELFEEACKEEKEEVKDLFSDPIKNQGEIETLFQETIPEQADRFHRLMSQYKILSNMRDRALLDFAISASERSGFFWNALRSGASLAATIAAAKILKLTNINKIPLLSVGNLAYTCFDSLNKFFLAPKTATTIATTGFLLLNKEEKTNKDFFSAVFNAQAMPFLTHKVFLPLVDVCKQKFSSLLPSFDLFDYLNGFVEKLPISLRLWIEGKFEESCAEQWWRELNSRSSQVEKDQALGSYLTNFKASQKRIFWGELVSSVFYSFWIVPVIDALFGGEVERQ